LEAGCATGEKGGAPNWRGPRIRKGEDEKLEQIPHGGDVGVGVGAIRKTKEWQGASEKIR